MKTTNDVGNLVMEDVQLVLRNFSGKEALYNSAGNRNFAVLLDEAAAQQLISDGWAVKWFKIKEPGDLPQAFLKVKVHFGGRRPPRIVLITSRGRTPLDEDTVDLLDAVAIKTVDLIVRPYEWTVKGESGVKAYLQSIFVTIEEDMLERKYADLEERGVEA